MGSGLSQSLTKRCSKPKKRENVGISPIQGGGKVLPNPIFMTGQKQAIIFVLIRPCLLITVIKCLRGHKSLAKLHAGQISNDQVNLLLGELAKGNSRLQLVNIDTGFEQVNISLSHDKPANHFHSVPHKRSFVIKQTHLTKQKGIYKEVLYKCMDIQFL